MSTTAIRMKKKVDCCIDLESEGLDWVFHKLLIFWEFYIQQSWISTEWRYSHTTSKMSGLTNIYTPIFVLFLFEIYFFRELCGNYGIMRLNKIIFSYFKIHPIHSCQWRQLCTLLEFFSQRHELVTWNAIQLKGVTCPKIISVIISTIISCVLR